MSEFPSIRQLEVTAAQPDTVSTIKEELKPIIETALREVGQEALLAKGDISIDVEQTFPAADAIVMATVTLLSKMAYDVFTQVVLPKLKERFKVEEHQDSDTNKE
jgi:hypothetical protein